MKKWIQKYSPIIAGVLLVLLAFKSCQSCSRSRAIQWTEASCERVVDSIQHDRMVAWDSVRTLKQQVQAWEDKYELISNSLNYTRDQNSSLVRTIMISAGDSASIKK